MKGGLGSGAMLFLYKATRGDVSLDTAGVRSRKQICLITAPRVGVFLEWLFWVFSPFFSPSIHHFTHTAGVGCLMGWLVSAALGYAVQHLEASR